MNVVVRPMRRSQRVTMNFCVIFGDPCGLRQDFFWSLLVNGLAEFPSRFKAGWTLPTKKKSAAYASLCVRVPENLKRC
jgi:hypothetical protein